MTMEEAIRILDEVIPPPEHHTVDLDHLLIAQAWLYIKKTLTAEPKHGWWGRWKGKPIAGFTTVRCSICGTAYLENNGCWNFCPNCGADMRGGENGRCD